MQWPTQRLERTPPGVFKPRHCPRPECPQHLLDSPRRFRYTNAGAYERKSDGRRFPRFRCLVCNSRFSQSAFTVSYYLKRPGLLVPIAAALNAGSANRQIARSLGCAPSTVTRLSARLGRHALLLQALALEHLQVIDEPVVLDHFETFVFRQEEALGVATAVGQKSWFVYAADPAPHRRGGKRTPAQQRKLLAKPVCVPRDSIKKSTERVLALLRDKTAPEGRLELITDGHRDYARAIQAGPEHPRVIHRSFPNPKRGPKGSQRSLLAKIRDENLEVVDVLHGLLRHTCAHHRRETIAFGRRTNAVMERLFLTLVWRNFVKKVTERHKEPVTTAMEAGLTGEQWSWDRVLARRLFPSRIKLPEGWLKIYRRDWITESIGPNTQHRLRYAF